MDHLHNGIFYSLIKTSEDKLRKRVDLFVYDDKGRVLVGDSRYHNNVMFPGGGVDDGLSIDQAARREALEEAGVSVGKIHGIGMKPMVIKWTDETIELNKKKGRDFTGNKQYFRAAPIVGSDKELYATEGDALKNQRWMKIDKAVNILENYAKTKGEYYDLVEMEAESLKRLKEQINS